MNDLRWAARERLILDAAAAQLRVGGYAQLNLDELARALSMSKGTLYRHFASKEDIAAAVIADHMQRVGELQAQVPRTLPPLQRLEVMLHLGLTNRLSMNPTAMGLPMHLVHQNERLRAARDDAMRRMHEVLVDAQEAGQLRPELPLPFILAWFANLFGSGIDFVVELTALPIPEVVSLVTTSFLRGIGSERA